MSNEQFVIKGKAYWASVREPSKESGKYQLDLSIDENTAKLLSSKGVKVRTEATSGSPNGKNVGTKNDRGTYVTLKANAETKDGKKRPAPLIVDAKKNPLAKDRLIGNGSIVNVTTAAFDWEFKGKKGTSLNLAVIQVLELVGYANKALDLLTEEDGYVEDNSSVVDLHDDEDGDTTFNMD
jgi:hypothetical protein